MSGNNVDERIVSMMFDNSKFEKNAQTTMKTLDVLKEKLKFDADYKGLNGLADAAKKVSFDYIAKSAEKVSEKITSLEWVAIGALQKIGRQAVEAGEKFIKSLTIDPVTTGFKEYELKMNSIQTIMASTGESINVVNQYLNELNEYSDKTIYSFSDMTSNIGKFTNAGVKLRDAVDAMRGISNEAALSGANAAEASRAMYNLAQSMSMGYVQYIDWKSIENANMATQGFKEQLSSTAVEMGKLKKTTDGFVTSEGKAFNLQQLFKDGMKEQWLTTDVLVSTLKKYSDETTEIGKKAYKAATEVKTFSMMIDTLKEAAQSGWAQTWEAIFGDFYSGKSIWTSISNSIGSIIDSTSKARNALITQVMDGTSKWDIFKKRIDAAGISESKFKETLIENAASEGIALEGLIKKEGSLGAALEKIGNAKELVSSTLRQIVSGQSAVSASTDTVVNKLEEFQTVVTDVIRGNYGNGEERIRSLTEANYDYATIQGLVNKIWERNGHTWDDCTISAEDLTSAITAMSDAELTNIGFTDQQIKSIRLLASDIDNMDMKEFIDMLTEKPSGRELLFDSIRNSINLIKGVIAAVGKSIKEVFSFDGTGFYKLLEAIDNFTKSFKSFFVVNDETGELAENASKLKDALKLLLVPVKWLVKVAGPILGTALKGILLVLKPLGQGILDILSFLGKKMGTLDRFIEKNKVLAKVTGAVSGFFDKVAEASGKLFSSFANSKLVIGFIDALSSIDAKALSLGVWNALGSCVQWVCDCYGRLVEFLNKIPFMKSLFETIGNSISSLVSYMNNLDFAVIWENLLTAFVDVKNWFSNLDIKEIGSFVVEGFKKGINLGITGIPKTMIEFGKTVLQSFKAVLGIHSPSTEFEALGEFSIEGYQNGFKNKAREIGKTIGEVAGSVLETAKNAFSNLDIGSIFSGAVLLKGFSTVTKTMKSASDITKGTNGAIQSIVSGPNNVLNSVAGVIAETKGVVGATTVAVKGLSTVTDAAAKPLAAASEVVTSFAEVVKKVAKPIAKVVKSTTKVVKAFAKVVKSTTKVVKSAAYVVRQVGDLVKSVSRVVKSYAKAMEGLSFKYKMEGVLTLAKAMAVLVGALLLLYTFASDMDKLWSCTKIMLVLAGTLAGLAFVLSKMDGPLASVSKEGATFGSRMPSILLICGGLYLLASAIKKISKIPGGALDKAMLCYTALVTSLLSILVVIDRMDTKDSAAKIKTLSTLLRAVTGSLIAIGIISKLVSGISWGDLSKTGVLMAAMSLLVLGLVKIGKTKSKNIANVVSLVKSVSMCLVAMAAACFIISGISWKGLAKAGAFIGGFAAFVAILMLISNINYKEMDKVTKLLWSITGVLSVMALVCLLMNVVSWKSLAKSGVLMGGILVAVSAIMLMTNIPTKSIDKVTGLIFSMAGCLAAAALVCIIMNLVSYKALDKAGYLAIGLLFAVGILMELTKIASPSDMKGVSKVILAFSAAMAILSFVIIVIGLMPVSMLKKGVIAIAVLGVIMSMIIAATKNSSDASKNLIAMAAAIGILTACIILLSMINPNKLKAPVLAIGALMLIFGLMAKLASNVKSSLGSLIVLVVAVGVIGGVMYLLSSIPSDQLYAASIALSGAMMAFGVALTIIGALSKPSLMAVVSMGVMTIVLLAIAGVFKIMSSINVEKLKVIAYALCAVMLTFSIVIAIVSAIGLLGPGVLVGVAAMGAMVVLAGLLGLIMGLLTKFDVFKMETVAATLCDVMTRFTACLVILTLVGIAAPFAIAGIVALGVLMTEMIAFATIVGALVTVFPKIGEFIDNGLPVLEKLATGLGHIFGNVIAGIMEGVATGIQHFLDLGDDLVLFGDQVTAFASSIKSVDQGAVSSVGLVVDIFKKLTGASLKDALVSFISFGKSDFTEIGDKLVAFGSGAISFSNKISGINADAVDAADTVASMVMALNDSFKGKKSIDDIFGDADLDKFKNDLTSFGDAIAGFAQAVKGKVDAEEIDIAVSAGKMISTLYDALGRKGGTIQKIFGENMDLTEFGTQMEGFGASLRKFCLQVSNGHISTNNIEKAVDGGKMIASLYDSLKVESGAWQDMFGKGTKTLDTFGEEMETYGACLRNFCNNVAGSMVNTDNMKKATDGGAMIASLYEKLKVDDGAWQDIFGGGTKSLSDFGEDLLAFGQAMVDWSEKCDEIDNNGSQKGVRMTTMLNNFMDSATDYNSESFTDFADGINTLIDAVNSIPTVSAQIADNFIAVLRKFIKLPETLLTSDKLESFEISAEDLAGAINQMSTSIKSLLGGENETVKDGFRVCLDGLSGVVSEKFVAINEAFKLKIDDMCEEIKGRESDANDAFSTLFNSINLIIFSFANAMTGIGESIIDNLLQGMKNKDSEILNQARIVGKTIADQSAYGMGLIPSEPKTSDVYLSAGQLIPEYMVEQKAVMEAAKNKENFQLGDVAKEALYDAMDGMGEVVDAKAESLKLKFEDMVDIAMTGLAGKDESVNGAIATLLKNINYVVGQYTSGFVTIGETFVKNLKQGLENNVLRYSIRDTAYNLGHSVYSAVRDGLGLGSTNYGRGANAIVKDGQIMPKRIIEGMTSLDGEINAAGSGIGRTAIQSISKALQAIPDTLDDNMDSQFTIRPVVDLSDVSSGARQINGMFNMSPSVGLMRNIAATAATSNISRVTNGDVVSAINDLSRGLGNVRGDTYNVNGVTYDDGTNVANAVQTLIRAARIEGRR